MFEVFKEYVEKRHEYARKWKEKTGGKVVGYFCTYVPEEILYAANILPVRIYGSHEPLAITEPHIFAMFCPFCRDVLAQGLLGRYDYLDGIVIAQSCLHMRQAFCSWRIHVPVEFSYYIYMPHGIQTAGVYSYTTQEFIEFKKAIEKWIGREITDEKLDEAIAVYNRSRSLMRKVYEFRKRDNPPLTGEEAMYVVLASQVTDKKEFNSHLERILEKLPERELKRDVGIRLMICGSENDDTAFMRLVETRGATFVIDDHCSGSRYIWNDVLFQENRIAAIATRYVDRIPCPSKDWPERRRLPHILKLARDYKVEGVITIQQKFCDPHELDTPIIRQALQKIGIPSYHLEFDVTIPVGQFATRIEAFIEQCRWEELF